VDLKGFYWHNPPPYLLTQADVESSASCVILLKIPNMNELLTEGDIQWLAKILAMIPALSIPPDSLERLQTQALIEQTPIGWQATEKGVLTIISWKSPE